MNVFLFKNYRDILSEYVKERKEFEPRFGFQTLAKAARVQPPYLSKVLNGQATLSSDQLYLLQNYMKLDASEKDFLSLLHEYDRSAIEKRRSELKERIDAICKSHSDSSAHLNSKTIRAETNSGEMAEYYLEPLLSVLHIAISIPAYSKAPLLFAKNLGIEGKTLHELLATLERLGLAEKTKGRYIAKHPNIHLAKSSPIYKSWRNQMKLLAIQKINQQSAEQSYSFHTVFSADQKTRQAIHQKFLEFLQSCESLVKDAPTKEVFQLSFDLFDWN